MSKIDLEDVYIQDHNNDTLFFVKNIYVGLPYYIYNFSEFEINKVILNDFYFKYTIYKNEEHSNFHKLMEYFSSQSTDTTSVPFFIKQIELFNSKFSYLNYNDSSHFGNLQFYNINVLSKDFEADEVITMNIEKASFYTNKNNQVESFSSYVSITEEKIHFNNAQLKTDISEISLQYFDYYINNTTFLPDMYADFEYSNISSKDFFTWVNGVPGSKNYLFNIKGKATTEHNILKTNKFQINFGLQTELTLDAKMFFLEDVNWPDGIDVRLDINKLQTNKTEIHTLLNFVNEFNHVKDTMDDGMPSWLSNLNEIFFEGIVEKEGRNSFLTGNFLSNAGNVSLAVTSQGFSMDDLKIQGNISSASLDLEKFIVQNNVFSNVNANISFELQWINSVFQSQLNGSIDSIKIYSGNYENITLEGKLTEDLFTGNVTCKDDKMNFNFNGTIDFSEQNHYANFTLQLANLSLSEFNVLTNYTNPTLQTLANVQVNYLPKTNQYNGNIQFTETIFQDARPNKLTIHSIVAELIPFGDNNTKIDIETDFLDISYTGNTNFNNNISDFTYHVFSAFKNMDVTADTTFEFFNFYVKTYNTRPVFSYFFPDIYLEENTTFLVDFLNTKEKSFEIEILSNKISYKNMTLFSPKVNILKETGYVRSEIALNSLSIGEKITLITPKILVNELDEKRFSFNVLAETKDDYPLKLLGNGLFYFTNHDFLQVEMNKSSVTYQNEAWNLELLSNINIDSGFVYIPAFSLDKSNQFIHGTFVLEHSALVKTEFQQFQLELLNSFIENTGLDFSGIVNGKAELSIDKNIFLPIINIDIEQFVLNGQALGNGNLFANYKNEQKKIFFNSSFYHPNLNNSFSITGNYSLFETTSPLFAQLVFNPINFNLFSNYSKDVISDIEGSGQVNLNIQGNLEKPKISGFLRIDSLLFTVDYLKTKYKVQKHDIIFKEDWIGCDNLVFFDENNNKANANLTVFHNNYSNINYDITINVPKTLQCLNTKKQDNSYFYGTAFLQDATINITGYDKLTNIEVIGTTDKKTNISIPMDSPSEISENNFIVFKNKESKQVKEKENKNIMPGLNLDIQLKMTPDAHTRVVFDERAGDIINVDGEGDVRMVVNDLGKFQMYGEYLITKGDYLFTYERILNKKFQISPGSKISWSGDPYKAYVDINAIYRTNISIANLYLSTDSTNTGNNRRIPVDCRMHLTQELMKPMIDFHVDLPSISANDPLQDILRSIMNNRDEERWQFFSLLVLNRFDISSENSFSNVASATANNPYELLSNQVSKMLSKNSKVAMAVNYRPSSGTNTEQMQMGLSTQLFNDRLILEGSLGVTGTNTNIPAQNTGAIAGDVYIEYRLSKDGATSVKAYNKSNTYNIIDAGSSPYTQGVGLTYRKDFNNLRELFNAWFKPKSKVTNTENIEE